jgi:hypothetical protein
MEENPAKYIKMSLNCGLQQAYCSSQKMIHEYGVTGKHEEVGE